MLENKVVYLQKYYIIMELIKIKRLSNRFGGLIKTQADLEDALGGYSYKTQEMYLNTAQIRSISDIKTCKEYYSPHDVLGDYFTVSCVDGTIYHFPKCEFDKFEKYIIE
jgi:hypothetical protein